MSVLALQVRIWRRFETFTQRSAPRNTHWIRTCEHACDAPDHGAPSVKVWARSLHRYGRSGGSRVSPYPRSAPRASLPRNPGRRRQTARQAWLASSREQAEKHILKNSYGKSLQYPRQVRGHRRRSGRRVFWPSLSAMVSQVRIWRHFEIFTQRSAPRNTRPIRTCDRSSDASVHDAPSVQV